MEKKILNVNQARELLGVSKSTLYKATSNKSIPHYKSNGKLYFVLEELVAWMLRSPVRTADELRDEAAKNLKKCN